MMNINNVPSVASARIPAQRNLQRGKLWQWNRVVQLMELASVPADLRVQLMLSGLCLLWRSPVGSAVLCCIARQVLSCAAKRPTIDSRPITFLPLYILGKRRYLSLLQYLHSEYQFLLALLRPSAHPPLSQEDVLLWQSSLSCLLTSVTGKAVQ